MDAAARACISGTSLQAIDAKDHGMFVSSCWGNAERVGIDCDAIACQQGLEGKPSADTDQAGFAIP